MLFKKVTQVLVGLILISSVSVFGQDVTDSPPTLREQFNTMIEDSETFKQYKVIDRQLLRSFWSTLEDSIAIKEKAITEANQEIQSQQTEIAGLEEKIDEQQVLVDEAQYGQDHINVIGIDFQKSVFTIIAFSIIGALLIVIAVGYGSYKKSKKIAADKTRQYDKLEDEYKDFQDKSREKQMKIKRELQTYVNKVEELKHKNISFK